MDIVLGDPIIPIATAVILLYMMHKRVPQDLLILIGLLIFNLNPLYVVIGFLVWKATRSSRKKSHKPVNIKRDSLASIEEITQADRSFDYILIGNSVSTLYTAALLSKVGQKCCVLVPQHLPCVAVHPDGAPCAVTIDNMSVGMR